MVAKKLTFDQRIDIQARRRPIPQPLVSGYAPIPDVTNYYLN